MQLNLHGYLTIFLQKKIHNLHNCTLWCSSKEKSAFKDQKAYLISKSSLLEFVQVKLGILRQGQMVRLLHWTVNPIDCKNKDFIILLNISICPGPHNLKAKKSVVSCDGYFQLTLLSLPFLPSMLVFCEHSTTPTFVRSSHRSWTVLLDYFLYKHSESE